MPIKVFAEPGHGREEFEAVERQVNEWERASKARIIGVHSTVNDIPATLHDSGSLPRTVIVPYAPPASVSS